MFFISVKLGSVVFIYLFIFSLFSNPAYGPTVADIIQHSSLLSSSGFLFTQWPFLSDIPLRGRSSKWFEKTKPTKSNNSNWSVVSDRHRNSQIKLLENLLFWNNSSCWCFITIIIECKHLIWQPNTLTDGLRWSDLSVCLQVCSQDVKPHRKFYGLLLNKPSLKKTFFFVLSASAFLHPQLPLPFAMPCCASSSYLHLLTHWSTYSHTFTNKYFALLDFDFWIMTLERLYLMRIHLRWQESPLNHTKYECMNAKALQICNLSEYC